MAKKHFKIPKHDSGKTITTKTYFGSDSSMVIPKDDEILKGVTLTDGQVVCKDDSGYYVTTLNHIDSGLADPNRYANKKSRLVLDN